MSRGRQSSSRTTPPKEIRIEIPRFMTHVKKSKTKFVKINGQRIYSGMNHHLRSLIVREMHNYIKQFLPKSLDIKSLLPIRVYLEVHAPINFGDVRMVRGEVSWVKPDSGYEARWDADNLWIWGKCFNDTLVELGYLPDDNVSYVRESGGVKHIPIEDFKDRKLVFVISKAT